MTAPPAAAANEFFDLMHDLADGRISPPQTARLEELLWADPANRQHYVDYMLIVAGLHQTRGEWPGLGTSAPRGLGTSAPSTVVSGQWPVASEPPPVGAVVELPHQPGVPHQPGIHHSSFSSQHSAVPPLPSPLSSLPCFATDHPFVFSYIVATLIFGVAGLAGWLYQVEHYTEFARSFGTMPAAVEQPKSPAAERTSPVARVTGLVDCRWSEPATEAFNGSHISQGRRFALASGLLQLTYDSGASVILQGPCTYQVDSAAGGYLSLGKLTAKVGEGSRSKVQGSRPENHKSEIINHKSPSPLAPNPSPLFTVKTPTAVVTDLGTEFGVEVNEKGITTSRVFTGSVKMQAVSVDGRATGDPLVLHKNELAHVAGVEGDYRIGLLASITPSAFMREIPEPIIKTLDLLDIVAGGNGTGQRRQRGLDPSTGMEDPVYLLEDRIGDRAYHPVAWHKLIDGVFIPDGAAGTVQLDSAGHVFDRFPATSGMAWASIWPRPAEFNPNDVRAQDIKHWMYALGHGEQYMPDGRGLLGMHPNVGITFDLEAIRKQHPRVCPSCFRATAGIASPDGLADIWVFVDGRLQLERTGVCHQDGPLPIDIAIVPADRFLTLVSTDAGNPSKDWVVFGDPVLDLKPKESANAK